MRVQAWRYECMQTLVKHQCKNGHLWDVAVFISVFAGFFLTVDVGTNMVLAMGVGLYVCGRLDVLLAWDKAVLCHECDVKSGGAEPNVKLLVGAVCTFESEVSGGNGLVVLKRRWPEFELKRAVRNEWEQEESYK